MLHIIPRPLSLKPHVLFMPNIRSRPLRVTTLERRTCVPLRPASKSWWMRQRDQRRKLICFVTGVPGAGKTLVGLNVATQRRDVDQPTHAVFLSGNGPLVAVLCEALTRDEVERQKSP